MTKIGRVDVEKELGPFADTIFRQKYAWEMDGGRKETWRQTAARVARFVAESLLPEDCPEIELLIASRRFMPGGRYLYAAGRPFSQCNNCLLLRAEDSKNGWGKILSDSCISLMSGMGIGVEYSRLRGAGGLVHGLGGKSSGPLALMNAVNEVGRMSKQGGDRRAAIWAGLAWDHPDCPRFVRMKDWPEEVLRGKERDFNFPAPMDHTNVSVGLNDDFFAAYADELHSEHAVAQEIYWETVRHMLETAEPGFSINCGNHSDEVTRNACCEVVSRTSGTVCNLGSLNMARFEDIGQWRRAVRLATAFLMAGTIRSDLPLEDVRLIRDVERRIGLGLMGMHEWLLLRGYRYGLCDELADWLAVWQEESDAAAVHYARRLRINEPIAKRSVAPTGTISIVAETTSGIEPILAAAYKRRYLKESDWAYQYVIDASARRVVERGVAAELIEDAYDLSADVERRVRFQAFVQNYTDMGISSTINLPAWGSSLNNESRVRQFGEMLLKYLPNLRGLTCYPDGCRGGQPLTKVRYEEAANRDGVEYLENGNEHACLNGVCGM